MAAAKKLVRLRNRACHTRLHWMDGIAYFPRVINYTLVMFIKSAIDVDFKSILHM